MLPEELDHVRGGGLTGRRGGGFGAAREQRLLIGGERGLDITRVGGDGGAELGRVLHGQVGALAVLGEATAFPADHVRALIGSVRAALCLEAGDLTGAERMLTGAYAAALATRDRPILALVAADAAALAQAHGRYPESAVLLGAAARLRGAHDRTDQRILELTRRGQEAFGSSAFATAYGRGWELDGRTAVTHVDPAVILS